MKLVIFLIGLSVGIALTNTPQTEAKDRQLTNDELLVLQSVKTDTLLQHYILNPEYRCQVKRHFKFE